MTKTRRVVEQLNRLVPHPGPGSVLAASRAIEDFPGVRLYRRELWREMKTAVSTSASGAHGSLAETALWVRDRTRRLGRPVEGRVISRTLLVKGLEFDHCVVLDADQFDAKDAYVAMTRGSTSLVVLSNQPKKTFKAVSNLLD